MFISNKGVVEMNEIVLKITGLTKKYKGVVAVDNLDMTLYSGDIYGLIGKNGAGKTTLIRLITSLSKADKGDIMLFDEEKKSKLDQARRRIGAVVEMPAFYPNLSAMRNLEYYRRLKGIPDKKVVNKTLKMVGLEKVGNKKFKNFSLGMKQRLGLGLALLNNPDFIILDEPINGLDPVGIIEIRETIKSLNQEYGITMLISSHILTELSMVATRYGIINDGMLIKELDTNELDEKCKKSLVLTVDNVASAAGIIETELQSFNYKIISMQEIQVYDYLDNPSEVIYKLSQSGVRVSKFTEMGDSLEDYYISLVGGAVS